jgi:hypothetical protein
MKTHAVSGGGGVLSADKLRSYCLYEAPSPDAITAAARRAGIPVDQVVEVSHFSPDELAS